MNDALEVMKNSPREWFDAVLNPAGLPWSVAEHCHWCGGSAEGVVTG